MSHFMNGLHTWFLSGDSYLQVRPLNFYSINFEIFNSVTSLGWSHLSRNLSVPVTASAAHRVIEILSQKCEYCLGRGMGWQIICVPVKFRSVHRAEQGWYQLKQKPDQSHTGPGDLPGLSADVSDNNVSLSHYYIKIPLAPGHFPWRCGRFLSPVLWHSQAVINIKISQISGDCTQHHFRGPVITRVCPGLSGLWRMLHGVK